MYTNILNLLFLTILCIKQLCAIVISKYSKYYLILNFFVPYKGRSVMIKQKCKNDGCSEKTT